MPVLKKQKRTVEEYQWQYYDDQNGLIEQLLRPVFLCLECQAGKGSSIGDTAQNHKNRTISR